MSWISWGPLMCTTAIIVGAVWRLGFVEGERDEYRKAWQEMSQEYLQRDRECVAVSKHCLDLAQPRGEDAVGCLMKGPSDE